MDPAQTDERGDALPCKRQRVTTALEAENQAEERQLSENIEDQSSCAQTVPSQEYHTELASVPGPSGDSNHSELISLNTDLHFSSDLDLSDDLHFDTSPSGGPRQDLSCAINSETGEMQEITRLPSSGLSLENRDTGSQFRSRIHDNTHLPNSRRHQSMEISSETAAMAENSYIKSVEKSRYSGNHADVESRRAVPSGDRHGSLSRPVTLSNSGYIDMFENPSVASGRQSQTIGVDSHQFQSSSTSTDVSERFDVRQNERVTQSHVHSGPGNSSRDSSQFQSQNRPFYIDPSTDACSETVGIHINKLPSSILLQIFRYFSAFVLFRKTSVVCKYWYNLSRDPDLWRFINLKNQHKLTDWVLKDLVKFSDRVLYVNLSDCPLITDVGVRAVLSSCSHLRTLKLMRCFEVTDETFVGLGRGRLCPQLQALHLDSCYRITDNTLLEVAESCPNMQLLHLNQCSKITDVGVTTLVRSCPDLRQVLLDHCDKVTDRSAVEMANCCPRLHYLNVMCCGMSDEGVMEFAKLKNLRNLDLSNLSRLTPRAVIHIARSCKRLECVNISLNSVMNDQCVSAIARNCEKLKRLYCVSCNITDTGLEEIAKYRPSMEALDVGWCQDVTDQGIRVVSLACPNLGYLGLIRCDKITLKTVEELVARFPHINYSTFILESRRLIDRARQQGFQFLQSSS